MPFGAELRPAGGVRFALWAPSCPAVALEIVDREGECAERWPMQRSDDGWHRCVRDDAGPGTRYRYDVGQGRVVPDPASRFNPLGVHGPSEVVDPGAHTWRDGAWSGLPWHRAAVYELHVGSFTPAGTLHAAAARLPYLHDLGIRAVELMPLAAFAGRRGWGYDGVLPFAVHPAYGTPRELKRFVDAAHRQGLMVLLDVVHNHFGPEGNYLHGYCPEFRDDKRHTPWGAALRLDGRDGRTVRQFFIDNALYWVEEYRFDGLRLDAVHAMHDRSSEHLVEEIAAALRDGPGRERQVHLVLENDDNRARWLARDAHGKPRVATAQWNDDWHHAAHVVATGEEQGYYRDHVDAPVLQLACALAEGFVYQGQPSMYRGGRPRGEASAGLPPLAFVAFLQNHDQVGNRALGERLDALAGTARVELLLACLLLSPQVPMLFMGEEFAARSPFLYFCDFSGALAAAVTRGRRLEFADPRDAAGGAHIPDPNAKATFAASKLRWDERDTERGRRRLALVRQLLALRRQHLEPRLPLQRHGGRYRCDGRSFEVEWPLGPTQCWVMRASFGGSDGPWPLDSGEREIYRVDGMDGTPSADALRVRLRSGGGA